MQGYYLGPMDPTKLMSAFMQINSPNFGNPPDFIDFREVYEQPIEGSMHDPLVSCSAVLFDDRPANTQEIIQKKIANDLCTNYVVQSTRDRGHSKKPLTPDIMLFSKSDNVSKEPTRRLCSTA